MSDAEPSAPSLDYFGARVPFIEHIGVVPVSRAPDHVKTFLPLAPALLNGTGAVHGGRLMGALDFAMSAAAGSIAGDLGVATIDMTTSFLAPATTECTVEARCLRRGRSIAFCEGEVRDAAGELVARATGTFRLFPGKRLRAE